MYNKFCRDGMKPKGECKGRDGEVKMARIAEIDSNHTFRSNLLDWDPKQSTKQCVNARVVKHTWQELQGSV